MSVLKAKGIVLKEFDAGESGKTLIILAEGLGKIMVSARGAKKVTGKIFSASEIFTCSEFCFYEGKGFLTLTQAEVIEKFYNIRNDIERLSYAYYFSDLINSSLFEGMEADDVLRLLLRSLTVLSKTEASPKLAARVFELRLLKALGFSSDAPEDSFPLSPGAYNAISYIMKSDEKRAFSFKASEEVLSEIAAYTRGRIAFYMGKNFKSLDFAEKFGIDY